MELGDDLFNRKFKLISCALIYENMDSIRETEMNYFLATVYA